MTINRIRNIKQQSRRFKRRLWFTFVLPAFAAALLMRVVQTLARIKIRSLAVSAPFDGEMKSDDDVKSDGEMKLDGEAAGEKPRPEPVVLERAHTESVPMELVSQKLS